MKWRIMGWRVLLFAAGFAAYAGALWEPEWSTVDDGDNLTWTLELQQKLSRGDFSLNTLNAPFGPAGRYRPGFLLFRLLEHHLFGLNCWLHHLAHILAMLVAAQLLYGIARRATASDGTAWIAAFAFTFCGTNSDNWCRLDMDEFYVGCLAVLGVWLFCLALGRPAQQRMQRGAFTAASLGCFWLAFLTKETAPALIGAGATALGMSCFGAGHLLSKRNRSLCATWFVSQALLVAWLAYLRSVSSARPVSAGHYTSAYQVDPGVMLATAIKYADAVWNAFQFLPLIALGLAGWRLWLWMRGRRALDAWDGWGLVGLAWFSAFVVGLLPWKAPLARYLGAGVPGLALFIAAMAGSFLRDTSPSTSAPRAAGRTALRWLLLANLAFVPVSSVVRTYNYTLFRHDYDRSAMNVMATLAAHAPAGARLYINCPPGFSGIYREMKLLLALLFDRRDLTLAYINDAARPEPRPGDYLLAYAREGSPRNIEVHLPPSFHAQTLPRLAGRLSLLSTFRYDRHLLNSYPDAPLFNAVARLGIRLPDYAGMQTGHRRALFAWERSLVEWRIYRFER